ncbi:hypothetical protein FDP41_013224 [Naegleria fowleri]|uniref:Uncharacterized protein n=1 Tax=Naegleria fowleri TaxID=5763 RepID=A0A6A5C1A8_NAEFO|nr:uncharacterized protein FDP41_013224 [Naegleria fowleri]KAF0980741.1 hypothetical protein FDP41_013224 [Naegleria fowleri]
MPKQQRGHNGQPSTTPLKRSDREADDEPEIKKDIPNNNINNNNNNNNSENSSFRTRTQKEKRKEETQLNQDHKKVKFEEEIEEEEEDHSLTTATTTEDDNDNEDNIESLKQEPPQNRQPGLTDPDTKKELSEIISEIMNRKVTRDNKSPHLTTELPLLINSKAKTYQRFMEFMKEERQQKSTEKQRRKLLMRNYQPPLLSDWEKEKSLSSVATQGIVKLLNAVLQKKRESLATTTTNSV